MLVDVYNDKITGTRFLSDHFTQFGYIYTSYLR